MTTTNAEPTGAPKGRGLAATLRANLAGIAILVAVVGGGLYVLTGGATADYDCTTYLTSDQTPVGVETPVDDLGRTHIGKGSSVKYAYCPPASGNHWPTPQAPIEGRVYGLDDVVLPEAYIHNLEHGQTVILYRGDDAGAADRLAALQAWYPKAPTSAICNLPTSASLLVARFDKLPAPVVVLSWDIVYPLESVDTAAIEAFIAKRSDRGPEAMCAAANGGASPTPGPMTSTSPTP